MIRVFVQSGMCYVAANWMPARAGDWCLERLYHRWHTGHFPWGDPCRRKDDGEACGL